MIITTTTMHITFFIFYVSMFFFGIALGGVGGWK
jgi:hypothetical protein